MLSQLFHAIAGLLGGIGLFMLGMWLLSDGLKLAAGGALQRILAQSTRTRWRALASGIGLTAAVQSSSAVTVATVGFVNAGLVPMARAVWVMYGSNIGTTTIGWIVALTGLQMRMDAWALPLVGIGMLLRLGGRGRRAAYGQALVGLAVFLLGIAALKEQFAGLAGTVDFSTLPDSGLSAAAMYFAIGLVLTLLVQSSGATVVITLSAAAAGIVPVPLAALVIIGADLGTSSTAALSAIGASANAKRAAASHVLFNLVTMVVTIASLPLLLAAIRRVLDILQPGHGPVLDLVVFTTLFNVLGVLVMLPITPRMVRFLERHFSAAPEDLARPRYLDDSVLAVPELALGGLLREAQRLGGLCLQLGQDASQRKVSQMPALRQRHLCIDTLAEHIRVHISRLNRAELPASVADALVALLRGLQHYEQLGHLAVAEPVVDLVDGFETQHGRLLSATLRALQAADSADPAFHIDRLAAAMVEEQASYQAFKRDLLQAAALGHMPITEMDMRMQDLTRVHQGVEQAEKAALRLGAALLPRPSATQISPSPSAPVVRERVK